MTLRRGRARRISERTHCVTVCSGKEFGPMICNLCQSENARMLYKGNIHSQQVDHFSQYAYYANIYKCQDCGLVYQEPIPQAKVIELVSSEKYLSEDIGILNLEEKGAEFERLIEILQKSFPLEGKTLLDVGCNTGAFLQQAKRYTSNIFGLEPSTEAAQHCVRKGLTVQNAIIRDIGFSDEKFDVITMWDVIEHLFDPVGDLKILHKKLKPGGVLVVLTHNIDSLFSKVTGKSYPMLMYQHLFHFSRKTLKRLLRQAGFEIADVSSFYKSWSLRYLYSLFDKLWPNSKIAQFLQICLKPLITNKAVGSLRVVVPVRDFFIVVARKV